MKTDINKGRT